MPSTAPRSAPIPILVCGEPARGDDAAAFAAAARLSPETLAAARVQQVGQLDVLFLLELPDGAPCVVVDAVAGLAPGEVWVRPLAALVDRARAVDAAGRRAEPRSSHELPIDQVLTLAATLRAAPPAGTFVGIGGVDFGLGAPLSPAVAAAIPAFAAAIDAAVLQLLTPIPGAGTDPADPAAPAAGTLERVAEPDLAVAGTEARR
ncbi:MAG: hydrogenase maturation protease [Chloroflexota bacterium]